MTCPPAISPIITDLLYFGLLAIRASDDVADRASHADHLHNLPHLLQDFSVETLQYYWDVERPCFIERCSAEQLEIWESHWERLRPHVETANKLLVVN